MEQAHRDYLHLKSLPAPSDFTKRVLRQYEEYFETPGNAETLADIEWVEKTYGHVPSNLRWAVERNQLEVVAYLLPRIKQVRVWSVLPAFNDATKLVLSKHPRLVNDYYNEKMSCALSYLIEWGSNNKLTNYETRRECLKILVQRPDIDVNILDKFKHSPLFHAMFYRDCEIVDLLLARPDICTKTDKGDVLMWFLCTSWYNNSLGFSKTEPTIEVLRRIMPYGDINAQDNAGNTPLVRAAVNRWSRRATLAMMQLARQEIDFGITNKNGESVSYILDFYTRSKFARFGYELSRMNGPEKLVFLREKLNEYAQSANTSMQLVRMAKTIGIPKRTATEYKNKSYWTIFSLISDYIAAGAVWTGEVPQRPGKRRRLEEYVGKMKRAIELEMGIECDEELTFGEMDTFIKELE